MIKLFVVEIFFRLLSRSDASGNELIDPIKSELIDNMKMMIRKCIDDLFLIDGLKIINWRGIPLRDITCGRVIQ